jgi:hypothetical protein
MELFIRIKDGKPFEHPIVKENMIYAFPDVDLNNPGPNFAKFKRILQPKLGVYEVCDGCTYEWDGDTVKDVWHIRAMTAEEKQAKIDEVMNYKPYPSWLFVEETCSFDPPVPRPEGKYYKWDEESLSWVEFQPE